MEVLKVKNKRLLEEGIFSEVTFVVGMNEEERIEAHKCILSVSSPIFYSMFIEAKDKNEFRIPDVSPSVFKSMLKYFYINEYPELNEQNWASILYAAEKYEISDLEIKCIEFVEKNLTFLNACEYFNEGKKFQVDHLVPFVKDTIIFNADTSFTSSSFLKIQNNEFLNEILSSDKLNCDEIIVFRSTMRWASFRIKEQQSGANLRAILGPALYSIRFPLMTPNEFNNEVIPKDILTDEEIVYILRKKTSSQFKYESRMRCCIRFKDHDDRLSLRTKRHSIKFQVNCPVIIHAIGVYDPFKDVLEGRMIVKDDGNGILAQESFEIVHDNDFVVTFISFRDSINVHPNKCYLVEVELESINVQTWMGKKGLSEVTSEGVKWTFENDAPNGEQTNVNQGQIPCIKFCKILLDL